MPRIASNSSRVDLVGLGQELEDPAAVVVEDDDPHRGLGVAQGGERVHVVREAEVAGHDPGGPAGRRRGADPGGDQAVDPVRAPVGEEADLGGAAGQERLLVADRHARGGVDEVAVGVSRAERSVEPRLGRLRESGELGLDRLVGRLRAASQAPAHAGSSAPSAALGQALRRGGPGRRGRSRRRSWSARSSPSPGRRRAGAASGSAASHWRSGLQVGMSPKRSTSSGVSCVRTRPGDRLVGARRPARGRGVRGEAARSARRGSGSRSRAARAAIASRRSPVAHAARRRSGPAARPRRVRRAPRPAARRRRPGADATAVSGRSPRGPRAPAARSPSRRPGGARGRAGRARQTFRWTGPGRGSPAATA